MLLQNDNATVLPCFGFFFSAFSFDATFLHPQRHKVEQEAVPPETLFSGTVRN